MAEFLVSPWISALLIAVLAIEAFVLLIYWKIRQNGLPPLQVLSFLGAGAAFAAALGFALSGASPIGIGISLALAFFCHLTDLLLRWQKQS